MVIVSMENNVVWDMSEEEVAVDFVGSAAKDIQSLVLSGVSSSLGSSQLTPPISNSLMGDRWDGTCISAFASGNSPNKRFNSCSSFETTPKKQLPIFASSIVWLLEIGGPPHLPPFDALVLRLVLASVAISLRKEYLQ
eukprot:Gb_15020 [translate_table: standard]